MAVDSYSSFRLRGKYIGVARMLELQGIHSFLTLTDRTGAYFFVCNHGSAAAAELLLTGSEMSTLAGGKISILAGS